MLTNGEGAGAPGKPAVGQDTAARTAVRARNSDNLSGGAQTPFAELDIAVLARRDDPGEHLIRELQRTRARVCHIWPMPGQIPVDYDVVFCELCPDLPKRLPCLPGTPSATLIIVLPVGMPLDLGILHNCAPHAVLHFPVMPDAVLSALATARSHFLYERRLRSRVEKLDDNLRTMRSVERAKAILIDTKKLSEQDAYQFLRRTAMERRVSIGALAAMIVDSQELLG